MSKKFYFFTITNAVFLTGSLQADNLYRYQHPSIDMKDQALSDEKISLLYLSCGYSNLISGKYRGAFEDYQKALSSLQGNNNLGMEFLVSFGMAVACDHLQLANDAQKYLSHIKKLIDTCDPEDHGMSESVPQDEREVAEHLRQIAFLSSSIEVRSSLISFISEIFPSSLASHSSRALCPKMTSHLPSAKNTLTAKPCRSFWKTMKKIRDSIVETWNSFFQIYKDIKEIREDFKENQSKPV